MARKKGAHRVAFIRQGVQHHSTLSLTLEELLARIFHRTGPKINGKRHEYKVAGTQ